MPHPVPTRAAAPSSRVPTTTMPHNFARDRYAPCRTGSGSLNRAPPGIRSIARLARSVPVPRHTWPCRRSQTFSSGHQLPFTENR